MRPDNYPFLADGIVGASAAWRVISCFEIGAPSATPANNQAQEK